MPTKQVAQQIPRLALFFSLMSINACDSTVGGEEEPAMKAAAQTSETADAESKSKSKELSPMNTKTAQPNTAMSATESGARAAKAKLEASALTSAPKRVSAQARLNAPVEDVWAYISDHDNLVEYSNGLLHSAKIDRSGAGGTNGVGVVRECAVGDDNFVEEVLFYEAPYAFAYSAKENGWGLRGHLATVVLAPDGEGTRLEWSLHFDMEAPPEAVATMSKNMGGMIQGKLLPFFVDKFGGKVLPA